MNIVSILLRTWTMTALCCLLAADTSTARSPLYIRDDRNILLIITDDLGVDKVGIYAEEDYPDYNNSSHYLPRTPNIDALADVGVRLTNAWANPYCSPIQLKMTTEATHGRYRSMFTMYVSAPDSDHRAPA